VDFAVLTVLLSIVFWLYTSLSWTFVTQASVGIIVYFSIEFLLSAVNFTIPWSKLVSPPAPAFIDTLSGHLVHYKFFVSDALEDVWHFKATSPLTFLAQVTVAGVFWAWVGTLISGFWLLYLTLLGILSVPGIIHNRIPSLLYVLAEPYIKKVVELAGEKFAVVIELIRSKVSKNIPAAAPSPSPSSSSPVVVPETVVPSTIPVITSESVVEDSHPKED